MDLSVPTVLEAFREMVPIRSEELMNLVGLESFPYMDDKDRRNFIKQLEWLQRPQRERDEINRVREKYEKHGVFEVIG